MIHFADISEKVPNYGMITRFTQWSIGNLKIQKCVYKYQNGNTNSSEIWNWNVLIDDLSGEVKI